MSGIATGVWDRVRRVAAFSTDGMTTSLPALAPSPLPGTGVGKLTTDPVAYYLRLIDSTGAVVTVAGDQLFALAGFSAGFTASNPSGGGGPGTSKLAFSPLTLGFDQSKLSPELLATLAGGSLLREVDVLGYSTVNGALISDASFGTVLGGTLNVDSAGGITYTATYGSISLQHSSAGAGGTLIADPGFVWDSLQNVSEFNTPGGTPLAAPSTLPTSGISPADNPARQDVIARFILQNGTTLTVDGSSYFALLGAHFADSQSLSLAQQIAGSNVDATLGPVTLSFGGAGANLLLPILEAGTRLAEIDLLTYQTTSGAPSPTLLSQSSFGGATGTTLDIGNGGAISVSFDYLANELQTFDAAGAVVATSSWNSAANAAGYSRNGISSATPFAGPSLEPLGPLAGGVAAGADLAYYIRVFNAAGSAVTVHGDSFFPVTDFSFDAAHATTPDGKFGPLSLTLGNGALDTALLTQLGTTTQEIDLLGYFSQGPNAGLLVSDTSFGDVVASALSLDASGQPQLSATFAAIELQSKGLTNAGSQTVEPTGAWNAFANNATFQTQAGAGSTIPQSEPASLPGTGVSTGTDAASYYVRLYDQSGVAITVNGNSLFALPAFSFDASRVTNIVNDGISAGKLSLDPLDLTLTDTGLNSGLFAHLSGAIAFSEIDVLGYGSTDGALLSDTSFGDVVASTLDLTNSGSADFTANYGAVELQHNSVGAGGTLVADPVSSFDAVTNTANFSRTGTVSAAPFAAPNSLPATGLSAGTPALTYVARLIAADGTTLTAGGNQLFGLTGFTLDPTNPATLGATLGAPGRTDLGVATLTFGDATIAPTLFQDVANGAVLGEIDILGYNSATGLLVTDDSLGGVAANTLTTDSSGLSTFSGTVRAQEVQQIGTNGIASGSASWDEATNAAGFATGPGAPASPAPAPTVLPASGVSPATPQAVDSYVRFINTDGSTLTVDGNTLFQLADFSTDATHGVSGVTTLDPLALTLAAPSLDPTLLSTLATTTPFREVDVLGYRHADGLLLSDDSFGLVNGGALTIDSTGDAQYSLQYGARSLSYSANGLNPDPGPNAATGSLTIGHNQTRNVTALVNGLITPGVPGDTETITAVTGHATLTAGVVTYLAPTAGPDSFTYTVTDQLGDTATGTVNVTVDPGPATATGALTIGHNQTSNVTALLSGLVTPGLTGDTDTITAVSGHATLTAGVVTYVAPATGPDSFTYTVTDQLGDTATGTVNVTVDPGPAAATGALTIGHGQSTNVTSLVNALVTPGLTGDTDTITAVSSHATLTAGIITYVAPATGPDSFTYTVTDQHGDSAIGRVNVTVDPGPATATGALTIGHNQTSNVTPLLTGLITPGLPGDTDTISSVTGHATLTAGVVTYVAPATGPDSFAYTVTDQLGDTATGAVNVTVDPGPAAATGALTIGHGQSTNVTSLVNALVTPGLTGDTDTITAVSGHATLTAGVVTYVAPATGPDSFTYTVTDQLGDTATGTVNVTVDPGPATATGALTIGHGQSTNVTSLVNALVTPGLTGDTDTITAVSGHATLTAGIITYVAPATGPDSFAYTVTDQLGDTATGTVNVTVDPGPATATGALTIGHGQSTNVTSLVNALVTPGLTGDTDTITAVSGHATLSAGIITYVAPATGPDSFTYTVTDQHGDTATGTVNVTVDPGPATATGALTIGHGQSTNVTSLVNALVTPGLTGDTDTITAVSGHATLSAGIITYLAPATGPDSFTYTVTDQHGDSAIGTVNVTVDPGPTAGKLATTDKLGATANLTAAILGVDTPGLPDDTLTLTAINTAATAGAVTLVNGQLTYTASGAALQHIPANGSITDSFGYTVTDQLGESASATVTVTVTNPATPVNGPSGGFGTIEGTPGADVITAAGLFNTIFDNGGNDLVNAGQALATVYVNTGDVVVNLSGLGNTVQGFPGSGAKATAGADGNVTVRGSASLNQILLGNGNDTVTLTGLGNVINLGNGNDTVTLAGGGNTVTLGSGNDTVNASTGDTIQISATHLLLSGGHNDQVFVNAGPSSIDDRSIGTTAIIGPAGGNLAISDFATDPTAILDLVGGAGGYRNVAAVLAALKTDGAGGTLLPIGSGSTATSIDFIATGKSVLTAAHFRIG